MTWHLHQRHAEITIKICVYTICQCPDIDGEQHALDKHPRHRAARPTIAVCISIISTIILNTKVHRLYTQYPMHYKLSRNDGLAKAEIKFISLTPWSLAKQLLVCSERQSSTLGEALKSFVCVVLKHPVIAVFQCFTASTWRWSTQQACTSTQPVTVTVVSFMMLQPRRSNNSLHTLTAIWYDTAT